MGVQAVGGTLLSKGLRPYRGSLVRKLRTRLLRELLPPGPDPRGRTLDVVMLAVTGGRERTASELGVLFERAGLRAGEVVETAGPLRIVEARCGLIVRQGDRRS